MAIKVLTDEYVASHGKEPRGRGLWGFAIGGGRGCWLQDLFWHNGTYGEAKRAAIAHARAQDCAAVAVQP